MAGPCGLAWAITPFHRLPKCSTQGPSRPGLSDEAHYVARLYGADDYLITEMEAAAVALVIDRLHGTDRVTSLRGAVNFDEGNPDETTLAHLDPALGETAGGFAETVENIVLAGAPLVDRIVAGWDEWKDGVPAMR